MSNDKNINTKESSGLAKPTYLGANFLIDWASKSLSKNLKFDIFTKFIVKGKIEALKFLADVSFSKNIEGKSNSKSLFTATGGTLGSSGPLGPLGSYVYSDYFDYLYDNPSPENLTYIGVGRAARRNSNVADNMALLINPDNMRDKFKSLFNKAKLYVQKNQKADITVPTEQELLKVSNSAAVQQMMSQNNVVQVIENIPAPVVQSGGTSFLSVLGDLLGFVGGITPADSGGKNKTFYLHADKNVQSHHTGGKVMGRGDVIAILKGGETVRTEAQEKELQEQMLKKHFESFAPLVSGQGDEQQNQQNGAFSSYSEKKSAKPILQDRTRHDEEMIIGIVADAWKTNRLGFRRVLRAQ